MSSAGAFQFVHDVISGQEPLVSPERKTSKCDPKPERSCACGRVMVKTRAGPLLTGGNP